MKLQRWRVSATQYRIDRKPYCDDPVLISKYERPGTNSIGIGLDMFGPCRKCEKCLLFRKLKWRDRMRREIDQAERTWFITLTFSPIHLAGVLCESWRFPFLEKDQAVERAAYAHVQKYFKRLRKSGARFRYCVVFEYGEEFGRLHAHTLVHEVSLNSVLKRDVQEQWRSFTHCRLVKVGDFEDVATYVSKYLTKHLSKPRASIHYGKRENL